MGDYIFYDKAFWIKVNTDSSSIVAGTTNSSPLDIFFMVARKILPDRVLGNLSTHKTRLNAAALTSSRQPSFAKKSSKFEPTASYSPLS